MRERRLKQNMEEYKYERGKKSQQKKEEKRDVHR